MNINLCNASLTPARDKDLEVLVRSASDRDRGSILNVADAFLGSQIALVPTLIGLVTAQADFLEKGPSVFFGKNAVDTDLQSQSQMAA